MSGQWRLDGGLSAVEEQPRAVGLRVLIVDGHHDAADSLALLLRLWGHNIQVAYSAAEALETAGRFHPHIVISELILPKQDGCVLARQLRDQQPGLLLIALTVLGRDPDRARSREAGFEVHLLKPADPLDLVHLLRFEPE